MIGLELIKNNIEQDIQKQLNRIGILYRLHSRIKTADSITEKNERNHYSTSTKLMQDIIGFRVITYFEDDVKLVADYFSNHYIKEIYNMMSLKLMSLILCVRILFAD